MSAATIVVASFCFVALPAPTSRAMPASQPQLRPTASFAASRPPLRPQLSAAGGTADEESAPSKKPINPYLVLSALVLLFVSNQWARNLPSFLVAFDAAGQAGRTGRELMNIALNFDAQQYGLLVSYGFTLLYVACSFPAGIVCDIFSRKSVLLASAFGWSAATATAAAAQTYNQLLAGRVLLGMTQAFSGPAAHTLISTTFPPHRRATANAIYTSGIYLGAALASISVILATSIGWRATCLCVALATAPPAILLSFALPNDTPAAAPAAKSSTAAATPAAPPASATASSGFGRVLSVASVRWLLAGVTCRLFAGFAIGAWAAPYYRSAFPSRAREYAILNALIVAGGGTFAAVGGGVLADRLSADSAAGGAAGGAAGSGEANKALLPIVGALTAIPFWLLAIQSSHFGLSMFALLCTYLAAETWYVTSPLMSRRP